MLSVVPGLKHISLCRILFLFKAADDVLVQSFRRLVGFIFGLLF